MNCKRLNFNILKKQFYLIYYWIQFSRYLLINKHKRPWITKSGKLYDHHNRSILAHATTGVCDGDNNNRLMKVMALLRGLLKQIYTVTKVTALKCATYRHYGCVEWSGQFWGSQPFPDSGPQPFAVRVIINQVSLLKLNLWNIYNSCRQTVCFKATEILQPPTPLL
jgi:hypothetical protein